MRSYPRLLSYVVAIGSTAIALLLRLSLESLLSETIGGFFYIAILISTWYGGSRPGIVTVVLSALAIKYFFLYPRYQFWILQPQNLLQLSIFLLIALIINRLTSNFLNSKQKIQQLSQKLAQENAEQLRMALTAAHMGMWDWDIVTGEIKWSPEHEELFGMAVGTFDGKYETFAAHIHPDDRAALNQAVQQALQTHSIYQHEYRIIWADGSIHWLEARGQAFYNAAGQAIRMTGTVMAIDQHKQVQAALQQSERRYRSLVHASAQIVWRTDTDGMTIVAPEIWEEMSGQSVTETLGLGWLNFVHPDDRDRAIQSWEESYTNRSIYETEYRLRMKHGNYRDFAVRGVPILDADGEISEWIGTCTDITERKQAEITLQEREATLRLFAQYAPAGIAMFDREMRYVIASQRWVDDYHADSIASLIGRSHYEIFPEVPERWRQIHQQCLAGASEKCDEDLFVRSDGTQQWVRWEIHPWHTATDEIGGIIIFAEDITPQKQIEAALQQSEKRYRSLVHTSAQIVWRTDANGMATVTPEGWEEFTGQAAAEQQGWGWLDTVHPDDRDRTAQCWQESFTNRTFYETECRLRRKDGSYRDFAVRGVPILDDNGKVREWIGTCTDITERKQAEAALKESQIQLQRQLAEIETIYHSAPIGLNVLDTDLRFVRINQRLAEMNGFSVEAHIGRTVRELLPDIADVAEPMFRSILKTGEPILNIEIIGETPAQPGVQRTWLESFLPLKDGERIIGISTVCQEITERKQAEIALKQINTELEQRVAERTVELTQVNDRLLAILMQQHQARQMLEEQAQLLDLAHDTILTRDLNGAISFWNKGAEYMYGWKKGEVLGEISHTLLKTQFPQPLAKIEAELLAKGYWEGELIQFCRNAQPVTVASRWVLQTDNTGKPIKILEINNDITRRKQVETALQEYLHEVEDLYNNAPCGYHSLDAEGNCIRINDTELKWLGYTRDEMLHKNFADLVTSESKRIFQENFPKFKQQGWITNLEFEVVNKDGTTRWISLNATALKDEAGNFVMSRSTLFDISDRKRAEAVLRQYEGIVSCTKDGIALVNRNYIYQIVNQAYLDWCNKPSIEVVGHSKRDVLGKNLFDSVVQSRLDRCLAGEIVQYEQWFDSPNAVPQFMSVTYTPYREPDGSISGVIVSLRDLTQLKQAEQMLELQAVITRNMAEGIGLVRADNGVIVYTNPKFEQMFGYDCDELNGQHVSIVNYASESVNPEDVNQAIRSAVLQQGEATYEVHNVKKDGTPFWCRATCSVFSHPDYGDVLVAVHQDITERKRIEDALRESEEKFRQLAENIQAVFWMTDIHNQQVLYVSKAYETIWQRSCEDVYQNVSAWLNTVHPDDRSRVELELFEQAKTGQHDKRYRIIRPDGCIRWIRDRAFPIKNELGEIVRIAGIAEDITELQKVEQIKSEFISIVSHELRTPLTSIRAAMGLLNSGIYDQKPDKSKRMIEIAAGESERLVRLVNDILDLERLESSRAVLEKTTCEAANLIQRAVEGVKAIAKQQNITFNIHTTDAQVWASADAIIQTLTNLLSNALKFSPADSTITLSVQQQTDSVLFQISDRGRGIPADKLELIFGRFQQVDASDSRDKGGTGLGLAICRSIIDQHGGQIWAESTLGAGSTFFFTLPLVESKKAGG
ncbi:MAG: PAS domain S-box protein [Aulosira sp. ZfuVER01]|nr:PAS domain S-box protein [Aulosira sp. ZfuVER01]MDZ7998625.1 PAS domain S-box protein [Aulosira sp. DedVER01a]MDZ8054795.1 PAS domain S-box protein [Aulosira sp. ZfuCHP01]